MGSSGSAKAKLVLVRELLGVQKGGPEGCEAQEIEDHELEIEEDKTLALTLTLD